MTDPAHLSERDRAVRDLLAGARHDEPAPPEVVARLDGVLADLAAERRRRAPVVDLAARRRRRAASLLLAAAAVVAIGVGIDQVRAPVGEDASTAGAADSEALRAPPEDGSTRRDPGDGRRPGPSTSVHPDGTVRLSTDTLLADLLEARRGGLDQGQTASLDRACGATGPGVLLPVLLDGEAAVAVFREPKGDAQRVDVLLCAGNEPVRTVRLPAP